MKEKIAKWYRQGLWTDKMVQDAVTKSKLTDKEAEEIIADGQARIMEQHPDEEVSV